MRDQKCETYWARIYIAGDINEIRRSVRQFTWDIGLCVTVTPTDYIYTGGEESGAIIELINYPRFPEEIDSIRLMAYNLGMRLMHDCFQRSFSVMTPEETVRYTRGDEVEKKREK